MGTEKLPFFVYGTLRHGEGNYSWALRDRTSNETPARLDNAVMFDNHGFPYVALRPGAGSVIGEIMEVPEDLYEDVQNDLDGLEGFYGPNFANNFYNRVTATVHTDDGQAVRVWVYVLPVKDIARIEEQLDVIPSGDWIEHDQARVLHPPLTYERRVGPELSRFRVDPSFTGFAATRRLRSPHRPVPPAPEHDRAR